MVNIITKIHKIHELNEYICKYQFLYYSLTQLIATLCLNISKMKKQVEKELLLITSSLSFDMIYDLTSHGIV